MKKKNTINNIDFHTGVFSVFTTEFNYAIKTDGKNERKQANICRSI